MPTSIITMWLFVTGLISALWPLTLNAGPLDKLSAREHQAVEKCVVLIRERRLTTGTAKGAFRVATNTGDAWIEHYFTLEAVVALLATTDNPKSPAVKMVADYLTFYSKDAVKRPQGVAHNLDGPKAAPKTITMANKDYDSIDSYAGLFLLASARYHKITGTLPPQAKEALLVSLNALDRVINDKVGVSKDEGHTWRFLGGAAANGLPIARANFPHHQLMDAVEAHAGLREAVELFEKIDKSNEAKQSETLADGIAKGVALFAPAPDGPLYAFRLDNGNNRNFNNERYPGILANLFALSYFSNKDAEHTSRVWATLSRNGAAGPGDGAPIERWLIAATRVGPDKDEVANLRKSVTENAFTFGPTTYIDRLAITILALIGESSQYPVIRQN